MSREYNIEVLMVSLVQAIDHATKAQMGEHFISELKHLFATTMYNREEIKNASQATN